MDQEQLDVIRARLNDELQAIERQLEEYGAREEGSLSVGVDEGFADSAQATTERSELISLVEQLQGSRREVVDALVRMDEGRYGKCERCGEQIPFERLEAIPTARLCVTCKQAVGGR